MDLEEAFFLKKDVLPAKGSTELEGSLNPKQPRTSLNEARHHIVLFFKDVAELPRGEQQTIIPT